MGFERRGVRVAILRRRAAFISASLAALSSCGPAKAPLGAPEAVPGTTSTPPLSLDQEAPSTTDAGSAASQPADEPPAVATGTASASASSAPTAPKAVAIVCLSITIPPAVRFDRGLLSLDAESKATLDEVARAMQDHPHVRVEVQGHTDGSEPLYGRRLGEKRAEVATQYLIDRGVAAERLCPRGYGATRPRTLSHTKEQRAAHRRVEFRVLEADETCSR